MNINDMTCQICADR